MSTFLKALVVAAAKAAACGAINCAAGMACTKIMAAGQKTPAPLVMTTTGPFPIAGPPEGPMVTSSGNPVKVVKASELGL